jgi:ABC-type Mn2+/Zn2+ transport system ATPase subunit
VEALVRAEGLSAGYGRAGDAIVDVTFAARGGEAIGVLGPNGAGKTTLLLALVGELPATRGELSHSGGVALVPQGERSRLDFPVTALDVALMGTYGNLPWYRPVGRSQRAAAAHALARVGLDDVADVPYGTLSGGQRQRTLIARALAQDAGVLLLDEPLTGVDAASAQRILGLFDELCAEGRVLLVATHDLRQAARFDAVLCLNRHQVAFGPPERTLVPEVLEPTYGAELVLLASGERAVAVQHHHN